MGHEHTERVPVGIHVDAQWFPCILRPVEAQDATQREHVAMDPIELVDVAHRQVEVQLLGDRPVCHVERSKSSTN